MELNTHNEHEHASLSLKVLLLIFAVILIGVMGYLVWNANTTPDTTDNAGAVVKKTTTQTTTDANLVACGDTTKYGFDLTFDATIWKGHKVKETVPAGGEAIIYCYFNMPTTDADWATASSTNLAGYVSLFAVGVYTPAQWATAIAQPAEVPTELGHNASYYWGWSSAQAYPSTFATTAADVKNVVATFKIK